MMVNAEKVTFFSHAPEKSRMPGIPASFRNGWIKVLEQTHWAFVSLPLQPTFLNRPFHTQANPSQAWKDSILVDNSSGKEFWFPLVTTEVSEMTPIA